MDRGSDAMKSTIGGLDLLQMRQTRRGCFQELLGCEAKTEFKYFDSNDQEIGYSLQESNCCERNFCSACYAFETKIENMTKEEMITVERPFRCAPGACKCCCYQEMTIKSGEQELGYVKETCYYCVPSFYVHNDKDDKIYLVHPPTCCGGMMVNCCTEGNPCCGRGCCKMPFWIMDPNQDEEVMLGKILKKPKSLMTEVFTDAQAFDVHFPEGANAEQKALLVGSALFINALFFEDEDENK